MTGLLPVASPKNLSETCPIHKARSPAYYRRGDQTKVSKRLQGATTVPADHTAAEECQSIAQPDRAGVVRPAPRGAAAQVPIRPHPQQYSRRTKRHPNPVAFFLHYSPSRGARFDVVFLRVPAAPGSVCISSASTKSILVASRSTRATFTLILSASRNWRPVRSPLSAWRVASKWK